MDAFMDALNAAIMDAFAWNAKDAAIMDAFSGIILGMSIGVYVDWMKQRKNRASLANRIEEAKRSIVCKKCNEKYRPPIKMLRCGHSFCFQCIIESKQHDSKSDIACPTCRIRTPLPFHRGEARRSLPTNIVLEQGAINLGVLGEPCQEDSEMVENISRMVDGLSDRSRIFRYYYYNAGVQHNPRSYAVSETISIYADDTLADLASEIIFNQSFGPSSDSVADFPPSTSVNVDGNDTPSESVDDSSAIEDFSSRIDDE